MESWLNDGTSEFVKVTLHKDFIQGSLLDLRRSIENWLNEPKMFCEEIGPETVYSHPDSLVVGL